MANANETTDEKDLESEEEEDAEDTELDLKEEDDKEDDGEKGKREEGDDKGRKTDESPEARKARLDRQTAQHRKKHPELYQENGKPKDEKAKPADKKKTSELGYGELGFLNSLGIKEDDEQALAQRIMTETGKPLKDVVKSKYFETELKGLREDRAAADALPSSKRNGQMRTDSVEYWIAKGELPPNTPENRELRQKVVNAKMKAKKNGKTFADQSVVA